jgi:leader peptidase (prepilin peptidase)/N-methyltransferase
MLRGRCADCQAPISIRYPLVEGITGLAFGLLTWWACARNEAASAPAWCYLAAVGIALTAIDLDTHRLPNLIVLPSYAVLASLFVVATLVDGHVENLLRAVVGMIALAAFYLFVVLVYPKGMGFGDVKLAGLLGMAMGYASWGSLVFGSFAGFALGAIAGIVLIASGRGTRKTAVPFGPFMIVGAFVGILVGEPVASWYLQFVGTR